MKTDSIKASAYDLERLSIVIKEKANGMFDECAPFNDSPVDNPDYLFLMAISAAVAYQSEVILSNLEFLNNTTNN
tara:strand:- start:32827 stop:33051 length:225 start_codon:yes stop_codon:yes gene_type:complete